MFTGCFSNKLSIFNQVIHSQEICNFKFLTFSVQKNNYQGVQTPHSLTTSVQTTHRRCIPKWKLNWIFPLIFAFSFNIVNRSHHGYQHKRERKRTQKKPERRMENLKALERLRIPFPLSRCCLLSDFPFHPRRQINSAASNDGTVRQQIYTQIYSSKYEKQANGLFSIFCAPWQLDELVYVQFWALRVFLPTLRSKLLKFPGWVTEQQKITFKLVKASIKVRPLALTSSSSNEKVLWRFRIDDLIMQPFESTTSWWDGKKSSHYLI